MNTNDLKTFKIIPFGAVANNIGMFPTVEPTYTTQELPGKTLIDDKLVKTVQVVDTDTGYPLENVNVFVKGTNRGGITKADGTITLVAQHQDEVIVFSWQSAKREIAFKNLGSMVNIDTTLTQVPVQVTAGPATDKKAAWFKWVGIGIAGLVLINMFSDSPKKVKV